MRKVDKNNTNRNESFVESIVFIRNKNFKIINIYISFFSSFMVTLEVSKKNLHPF